MTNTGARRALDHLLGTRTELHGWYRLADVHWSFRDAQQQEDLLLAGARAWAGLVGHEVHMRCTSRPLSSAQWASDLEAATPEPLNGPDAFRKGYLEPQRAGLSGLSMNPEEVYLGIRIGKDLAGGLVGSARPAGARLLRRVSRVGELVGAFGLGGRPVTPLERSWLLSRSRRLGLPDRPGCPVNALGDDAMAALDETVRVEPSVFGSHVRITDGKDSAHVAVLTLAQWSPIEVPGDVEPWLHYAGRLTFPVEWSIRGEIVGGRDAQSRVRKTLRTVRDQQASYRRIELDVPEDVESLVPRARSVEREMKSPAAWEAARFHGWVHAAISADTKEDLEEKVDAFIDHYSKLDWTFTQTRVGQAPLVRSFIPCEPLPVRTYQRRAPSRMLAAGMPTIASQVGDPRGPRLGVVWGTDKKPVLHDPHAFMDKTVDASGLNVICGGLGAGKSGVLAAIAIPSVLRGATGVIFDPSGPLRYLVRHPLLDGQAEHLPLIEGAAGSLSPYRVVPEPRREDYADDQEWHVATGRAAGQRMDLAVDILRMSLSPELSENPLTETALRRAVRRVGGGPDGGLMSVLEELRRDGQSAADRVDPDLSRVLAISLSDVADVGHAPLMFGPPPPAVRSSARLTVLTMGGLELPRRGDRLVTTEQRLSLPLLHTGMHLATRLLYDRPKHEPKFFGADEVHFLERFGSGINLTQRLVTDGRKWGMSVNLATQEPAVFGSLGVGAFVATSMIGRLTGEDAQDDGSRLLGLHPSLGLRRTIGSLSADKTLPREFLYRDRLGNVDLMRIDLTSDPDTLRLIQKDVWAKDGERR